jgi:hypothetical protein
MFQQRKNDTRERERERGGVNGIKERKKGGPEIQNKLFAVEFNGFLH